MNKRVCNESGNYSSDEAKEMARDSSAGTGALIISEWKRVLCIELSDNMIPFFIFNLAVEE